MKEQFGAALRCPTCDATRVDQRHYVVVGGDAGELATGDGALAAEFDRVGDVICDDELLATA